jgi:predicted transcriptional regulator of viral defense system
MKYLEIREKLNNLHIFATKDILLIEPEFNLNNLTNWVNKKYILPLRKNFYIFTDYKTTDNLLFQIANRIYSPSYISLESAFSYYKLIPETVYAFTSITSRKTNKFANSFGNFKYQSIKPEMFWGYNEQGNQEQKFMIAEPEKALIDYLYLNTATNNEADFFELRFNYAEFIRLYNQEKLEKYLTIINNQTLTNRVHKFLSYYKNAQS